MSEKTNLRILYDLMRSLDAHKVLDDVMKALEIGDETDSITEATARMRAYCRERQIRLQRVDASDTFERSVRVLHDTIFGAIEQQTDRWSEGRWKADELAKSKKSLENRFREGNTAYKKSTWYGKTNVIKPDMKADKQRIPDEEMIMQCSIGLHRTPNEATQMMLWAGHHPLFGATREKTDQRGQMFDVLRRRQYGAKQWNMMLFAREAERDVVNYTMRIRDLIVDMLMRGAWAGTPEEAGKHEALLTQYNSDNKLYSLLLETMAERLKSCGVAGAAQLDELLESLRTGTAFGEVLPEDRALYAPIGEAAGQIPGIIAKYRIRLKQLFYLSRGLGMSRQETARLILRLGYFKHHKEKLVGEGEMSKDEAKRVLDCPDEELIGYMPGGEVSYSAQEEVYSVFYRRLKAYPRWAGPKKQAEIGHALAKNEQLHERELIDLLCENRLAGAPAQDIAAGSYIPDENAVQILGQMLVGSEGAQLDEYMKCIREGYIRRVDALLAAGAALALDRGEALSLLEAAHVNLSGEMRRMGENGKTCVTEDFCREIAELFRFHIGACMPRREPDDAQVTALFNRLIEKAGQSRMAALAGAISCYFSRMEHNGQKADKLSPAEQLCAEFARHGAIPEGRTLRALVELMSMGEDTEDFWETKRAAEDAQ